MKCKNCKARINLDTLVTLTEHREEVTIRTSYCDLSCLRKELQCSH